MNKEFKSDATEDFEQLIRDLKVAYNVSDSNFDTDKFRKKFYEVGLDTYYSILKKDDPSKASAWINQNFPNFTLFRFK